MAFDFICNSCLTVLGTEDVQAPKIGTLGTVHGVDEVEKTKQTNLKVVFTGES
ncbi:hypothetical protein [Pseudolactococcus hodotermopsidis]|uniref:hypothetical protein n=1 Tax=Pseudolactococcus hodotermopsidis TaxID=2709157 RepID=UPI00155646C9|nr:hypothetical protein [Lactococcus hodotermopsidis]